MNKGLTTLVALIALGGTAACSQQQAQSVQVAPVAVVTPDTPDTPDAQSAVAAPSNGATEAPRGAATTPAAVATATKGMKIYLDPATGQPRDPTAEEIASMNRARVTAQSANASPNKDPDTVTTLPNGQLEFHVPSRGMHELRVCRQPDGTLSENNCPPDAGKKP